MELSRCLPCAPPDYVPGQFYKRELPLLRAVIDGLTSRPSMLVIDGYVWLGATDAPGLGAHLFEELHAATPIVGVAKTEYRNDTWSERVYRGKSRKPLYVTAAGVETARAAALVASMHGKHRIPTLLKQVDRLARAVAAQVCSQSPLLLLAALPACRTCIPGCGCGIARPRARTGAYLAEHDIAVR